MQSGVNIHGWLHLMLSCTGSRHSIIVNARTAWRFVENVSDISTSVQINSFVPKYKIPAETINAGNKMAAPRQEPMSVSNILYSPFLQSKQLQLWTYLSMTKIQEDCW